MKKQRLPIHRLLLLASLIASAILPPRAAKAQPLVPPPQASASASASAQLLSLDDILSGIRQQHPLPKMYDADIRSADEAARGANSWMPPEIGTGLWMTPYDPSLWKKGADGANGMGQYMISVQQMLPNRKEQQAAGRYQQAISAVTRETKQAALNELYATAKKSYYDWLITEKKLSILDQDRQLLDFMIRSAELRYKNNLGKLDAYYKAKAELGLLESRRLEWENEIRQQKILLNTLLNRGRNEAFTIDTAYSLKEYAPVDTVYFLRSRSDIKALDKSIALARLQQDLVRARLRPQFGVRYDHMFGFGGTPMQYSLMAMVRLPLAGWSSGSYKANIESLNWKAESLNQQRQVIANQASGEAAGMLAALDSKKRQVTLYQQTILPALQKNYQVTQLSYEQNMGELLELFDAWQALDKTRLEYLQQLQDLLLLQVELDKILEQQ